MTAVEKTQRKATRKKLTACIRKNRGGVREERLRELGNLGKEKLRRKEPNQGKREEETGKRKD